MTDKNSEEDAGIDEGYREPKEKVQLAEVALRKPCFCPQANGRRSAYPLHTPCPTHRSSCLLVSKCVSSPQPDQYGLHFPGGTEASRRDAGRGWRKEAKQDQQRSETRSPGTDAAFLCCPYDKAWCFCMNGDCFNSPYISLSIHIDLEWNPQEYTTLLFLNCGMFSS